MATAANTADALGKTVKFSLGEGAARAGSTVLGSEAQITGNIAATGDIVIAGVIEGEVTSQGNGDRSRDRGEAPRRFDRNEVALNDDDRAGERRHLDTSDRNRARRLVRRPLRHA